MTACTALVPLDKRQQSAMAAIASTEARIHAGHSLPEFAYAKAFFRALNGSRAISSLDVRGLDPSYDPSVRGGATKTDYIRAIDVMIESRGEIWVLPISKSVLTALFPAAPGKEMQRRDHREDIASQRQKKTEEQEKQARMFIAENAKNNAWRVLQFCLPGEHKAWLANWRDSLERAELTEWDIRSLLVRWWSSFWIASVRTDWRWCDSMYELLNELDYVIQSSTDNELSLCRAALPLALPCAIKGQGV